VLLDAGKVEEALLVFYFNTRYFQYNPNVYDSYAEALVKYGQIEKAIETYEKVLLLDRDNSNAIQQLEKLKT
jgi:tetratricopeptide (TPR) repeat protein